MAVGTLALPGTTRCLLASSGPGLGSWLETMDGWELLPVDARRAFVGAVDVRFTALPWGSPLLAYGLAVLAAFNASDLPSVVSRAWRDVMIERVERAVLAEMVEAGVVPGRVRSGVAA